MATDFRYGPDLHQMVPGGQDTLGDAGTIAIHDSHVGESEQYTSLYETPCGDADAVIEFGQGGAAQANAYHGTQEGGQRSADASTPKLRNW